MDSLQPIPMFDIQHLSHPIFLSLHLFVSCSPPPPPPLPLHPPHPPDSCHPDPLAGATPLIGHLSRCVHPLSLMTTSRARRATWRTPSRALHALHPLIRGTARTGTPSHFPACLSTLLPPSSSPPALNPSLESVTTFTPCFLICLRSHGAAAVRTD